MDQYKITSEASKSESTLIGRRVKVRDTAEHINAAAPVLKSMIVMSAAAATLFFRNYIQTQDLKMLLVGLTILFAIAAAAIFTLRFLGKM